MTGVEVFYRSHVLHGNDTMSIIFRFEAGDAGDVNLEDYH